MERKPALVTYGMIAATLCLVAWAASARMLPHHDTVVPTQNPVVQKQQQRPRVEVVFALDTTGSMGGLIDGAKRKIWSIARFIAAGQSRPEVRIGLVAYRDHGDAYITRFYDLSGDLDTVFRHLSSFEAAGGGDTPEDVSKGLYDAVYRTSWTPGQSTLKLVYLVGDAPPHTDYHDGYDYRAIARHANQIGIRINTIRCGNDAQTGLVWNQIAQASSGEFASIDESGGVVALATPYDTKLAELNARLAGTAIGYGEARRDVRAKVAAAEAMPAPVAADRAGFFAASGGAVGGGGDLVDAEAKGGVNLATLAPAALPPEMRAMSPAARKTFVDGKRRERAHISEEISTLSHARSQFLKKAAPKADSFDAKVEATLRHQAKGAGLTL